MARRRVYLCIFITAGLCVLPVVLYLFSQDVHWYCMLCGKHRVRTYLPVLRLRVYDHEGATRLSRLLEPLIGGGRHEHEWHVSFRYRQYRGLYIGEHDPVANFIIRNHTDYEVLAKFEPEIAVRSAEVLLRYEVGDGDPDYANEVYEAVLGAIVLPSLGPTAEQVEQMRRVLGIPDVDRVPPSRCQQMPRP